MLRILPEPRFFRIYFSMLRIFENNPISLLRAVQCTKYDLWTRTVDYGLAQLSLKRELKTTTPTAAETSCKTHFSFIQKYYACKMLSNYARMKLLSAVKKTISRHRVTSSMQLQNRSFHIFYRKRKAENVLN